MRLVPVLMLETQTGELQMFAKSPQSKRGRIIVLYKVTLACYVIAAIVFYPCQSSRISEHYSGKLMTISTFFRVIFSRYAITYQPENLPRYTGDERFPLLHLATL